MHVEQTQRFSVVCINEIKIMISLNECNPRRIQPNRCDKQNTQNQIDVTRVPRVRELIVEILSSDLAGSSPRIPSA